MEIAIRLLNTLLPILYAVAALAYAVEFFRADPLAARAARLWLASVHWFA